MVEVELLTLLGSHAWGSFARFASKRSSQLLAPLLQRLRSATILQKRRQQNFNDSGARVADGAQLACIGSVMSFASKHACFASQRPSRSLRLRSLCRAFPSSCSATILHSWHNFNSNFWLFW